MVRCVAFFFIACLASPVWGLQADKPVQCPSSPFSPAADPKQDPQTFAWELFVYVNQQVSLMGSESTVLWETWASPQDLYCQNGKNCDPRQRPQWPDRGDHGPNPGPLMGTQILLGREVASSDLSAAVRDSGGEIRINCGTFKHISDNHLWYLEGQEEAFQAGKEVVFPTDAMEIKAYWINIGKDVKERYHWRKAGTAFYGLVSLSITSRALPHWFWATFEHVDNPRRCLAPCTCRNDTALGGLVSTGLPASVRDRFQKGLTDPAWLNYRLDGTQSAFSGGQFTLTDAGTCKRENDVPTLLANSILEFSLIKQTSKISSNTSSCITCHARATVDYQGNHLCILKEDRTGYVGEPLRSWYCDDSGKMKFLPLGFVWSLLKAEGIHGVKRDSSDCPKPVPVRSNGPSCADIPQLATQ